jgi:hypothetical protein
LKRKYNLLGKYAGDRDTGEVTKKKGATESRLFQEKRPE